MTWGDTSERDAPRSEETMLWCGASAFISSASNHGAWFVRNCRSNHAA